MGDAILTASKISALIHRKGYNIVWAHSHNRGDPEIVRTIVDEWQNWVRLHRPRDSWVDITECWNDFAETKRYVRYTTAPCRICRGQQNFFRVKCQSCWGRTPNTEMVILNKV